jgi:hypothetical protein
MRNPTALYHMVLSSSRHTPTIFFPWKPNAEPELLPEAEAKRTLEAVSSRPFIGRL